MRALSHESFAFLWQDRGADEDEEQWALSRFVPMVQELVENLAAGTLSSDDYPPVRAPDGRHAGLTYLRIVYTF